MKSSRSLIAITVLMFAASPSALITSRSIVGDAIPNFSVEDQFQKRWTSSKFTGKPTLFVLSDRDAYEHVTNWTDPLVDSYRSRIHFVPVADLRSVPGFLKGYIRDRFRGEFDYSVLMDWDGDLVEPLQIKSGLPTLVLSDASGTIAYRAWGKGSASQVNRMKDKISELAGA